MPRDAVNRKRASRVGSAATRWRIADAAVELFSARGYESTTLQQVADAAGVHVQTIYLVFGTKLALLRAALDVVRADGEDPNASPEEWPWARALVRDPDPASQLRRYAEHVRRIAPRAGPLVAEVRNAARANAELSDFLEQAQRGRYVGPERIVAMISERGALRRGLTRDRAADTLFGVASFESYELLVVDRHWTPLAYQRWLGDVFCDLLLEPGIVTEKRSAPASQRRGRR
jgi:AcrR family transcriptional regulator